MPFEPRLIPFDDEDLPEELLLVAQQLSADADRLALHYPADAQRSAADARATRAPEVAASRSTIGARTAALLALLSPRLLAGVGTVAAALAAFALLPPPAERGVPGPLAEERDRAVVRQPRDGEPLLVVPVGHGGAFFRDLNPSEQEAVLDLLEQDELAVTSVSI